MVKEKVYLTGFYKGFYIDFIIKFNAFASRLKSVLFIFILVDVMTINIYEVSVI